MYPREAIKTLLKVGDVLEQEFSHNKEIPDIKKLLDNELTSLIPKAEPFKIDSYARIYTEQDIKKCLYADTPVPISIPVRGNLELDKYNIIQITDKPITGYHMIILYGWCEAGWLVQNSWGSFWGTNGKAVLPYDYEVDSAWAISTTYNKIDTYQPIWKKVYYILVQLIKRIKEMFK